MQDRSTILRRLEALCFDDKHSPPPWFAGKRSPPVERENPTKVCVFLGDWWFWCPSCFLMILAGSRLFAELLRLQDRINMAKEIATTARVWLVLAGECLDRDVHYAKYVYREGFIERKEPGTLVSLAFPRPDYKLIWRHHGCYGFQLVAGNTIIVQGDVRKLCSGIPSPRDPWLEIHIFLSMCMLPSSSERRNISPPLFIPAFFNPWVNQ